MKWYAYFESTSSYELINENKFNSIKNKHTHDMSEAYLMRNLREFKNLKEAKKYLSMHFKGEISDAKLALKEIMEMKEK